MELGEDFEGVFALQPQHLVYGAAEKAAGRSPVGTSPYWGGKVPPWGTPGLSASRGDEGTMMLEAGWGQPAATRTQSSRLVPRPSSPRGSWFPQSPSTGGTTACVSPNCTQCHPPKFPPPDCTSSLFVYLPLQLDKRDARKQRDKVRPALLRLEGAPGPAAPCAPSPWGGGRVLGDARDGDAAGGGFGSLTRGRVRESETWVKHGGETWACRASMGLWGPTGWGESSSWGDTRVIGR